MTSAALLALLAGGPVRAAEHGAKTLDEAWIKAAKAGDIEGLVALYAPDATLFPPDMAEAKGKDAIRKGLLGLLGEFTVKEMRVDATYETSGDLSVGWGRFAMTVVPKKGGDPMTMEGRGTSVAKRVGGKWLYINDHASMPIPPPPAR